MSLDQKAAACDCTAAPLRNTGLRKAEIGLLVRRFA